jgi:hypothetical protein
MGNHVAFQMHMHMHVHRRFQFFEALVQRTHGRE